MKHYAVQRMVANVVRAGCVEARLLRLVKQAIEAKETGASASARGAAPLSSRRASARAEAGSQWSLETCPRASDLAHRIEVDAQDLRSTTH